MSSQLALRALEKTRMKATIGVLLTVILFVEICALAAGVVEAFDHSMSVNKDRS
jgi:hypothetical protein